MTAVPGPARMFLHPLSGELYPTIPRKRPVCQDDLSMTYRDMLNVTEGRAVGRRRS